MDDAKPKATHDVKYDATRRATKGGTILGRCAASSGNATCKLDGFQAALESCYSIGDAVRASWGQARDYCLDKGAHLPYVNSEAEEEYLVAATSQCPGWQAAGELIWLGLQVDAGADKNALQWGDGTLVDAQFWAQFSPDGTHMCTALRETDGMFELADCVEMYCGICEANPDQDVSASTEAMTTKDETTVENSTPKTSTLDTTTSNVGRLYQTTASDINTMVQTTTSDFGMMTQPTTSDIETMLQTTSSDKTMAPTTASDIGTTAQTTTSDITMTEIFTSDSGRKTEIGNSSAQEEAPTQCITLACLKELIEADPTDEEQLETLVEISTDLLEGHMQSPTGTLEEDTDRVTEIIEFLDETFSLVLSSLSKNRSTVSIMSRNIAFEAHSFSGQCGYVITGVETGAENDITLCTATGQGGYIGVGIACVPDDTIMFPLGADELDGPESQLTSCVVTLNAVEGENHTVVEEGINATMIIARTETPVNDGQRPVCAFWRKSTNVSMGSWSDDGCHLVGSNESHVICSCNHLTNFAVLVRVVPGVEPLPDVHTNILKILSIVGGVTSVTCLSITLIVYIWLKVYRSQTLVIHANLAVSILISQIIFLVGIDATSSKAVCKVVAALLHYSLLASFSWMMVEGANLYLKSTNIFRTTIHVGLLFALGWVTPLPIVGLSLGVLFNTYVSESYCWLSNENGLIWAFVAPVIIVILLNSCVLLNVIRVFLSLEAMADKPKLKRIKAGARAVLLLTPLLGITWLIGLFVNVDGADVVVSYIFVILNSSQGVFIFVLHCALNEEVGKAFKLKRDKLRKLHSSKVHPNTAGRTSKTSTDSQQSKPGKKEVAWGPSLSTDKTGVNSDATK
ncbi:adhesion G protein-coupled receptor E3-like [Patiria miniata]|uniref:Adhesion G-protein coupled receptor D1-like n=1 Tax=Patiria miniata TaxID=46514 RepID=A0A914AN96_PATMI|nr:adhesion G protein-coupled receptor E3-like [Patiria miniata]